ncbi:MAG: N-formylglutamate amidohydrolase [Cyclobacteriaceae bacterium]|nr:N-formylglutamate amidohydrolase [Cyclobacteriaceae bacterium]
MFKSILISCEHAGNAIPENHKHLFQGLDQVLGSHRGWDPGALDVATFLATRLSAPLFSMTVTRLLIEMNRSLDSASLFSEISGNLSEEVKNVLIAEYYLPYRKALEEALDIANKPVLHLSVHSFTPILNGIERTVDVGILFDPDREQEKQFAEYLKSELEQRLTGLSIKFNEPYSGTDDGIATSIRKKIPGNVYLGIELELNQKYVKTSTMGLIQEALYEIIHSR